MAETKEADVREPSAPAVYRWELEECRAPTLQEGDTLLYCEHGRVLQRAGAHNAVDYRSHWFRIVREEYGRVMLLVHHGGGEERVDLGYSYRDVPSMVEPLDSDTRYLFMHLLYEVHREACCAAENRTATIYKQAFVNGRLKKRKARGVNSWKVWIEPTPATITEE